MSGKNFQTGASTDASAAAQQASDEGLLANVSGADFWGPVETSTAAFGATSGASQADSAAGHVGAGGLTINIAYDASITALQTSDPALYAEYTGAIAKAVQYYENLITTPVTMTINFGYGEVSSQSIPAAAVAASNTLYNSYTWTQIFNAVQSSYSPSSSVQAAALATLSASDPTNGAGSFFLSQAEASALGLNASSSTAWAGISTLTNTGLSWNWTQSGFTANQLDVVGALEHEIAEDLGRVDFGGQASFNSTPAPDYSLLDLFRYTTAQNQTTPAAPGAAAGARDQPFAAGYSSNNLSYFSYNGQTVTLQYDNPTEVGSGADIADWTGSIPNDPYGAATAGAIGAVSLTDLQELSVLGYSLSGPKVTGTVGGQVITNRQTDHPFSKAVVTDTGGSTPMETVTITLSNAANGTLSNLGGGSYNTATGVYSVTGQAAAVTTALDGLIFTPTSNQVAPGNAVTTTFTIVVSDGVAAPVSDPTTTVTAKVPAAANDYDNNGASDLLWQSQTTGAVYEWAMSNGQRTGSIYHGNPSGWSDVGAGNFYGATTAADILWQSQTTGAVYEWQMSSGQHTGNVYLGTASGWSEAGVGDFFGNGTSDLLWQNQSTGAVYEWAMSNGQHTSTNDVYLGNLSGWNEAGVGNFYGPGAAADILWQNQTTGAVYEWQMSNGQHTGNDVNLGNLPGWSEAGVGDFFGDGTSDILWQNQSTGAVYEWTMSNGQQTSSIYLGNLAGWSVVGTGDYTGDGVSDILWQNKTSGDVYEWTMSNGQQNGNIYLGNLAGWSGK